MGVERLYCGPVDEWKRAEFVEETARELRAQGHKPYIVGDPVTGALGYVAAAGELLQQAEQKQLDLGHVFISASAGPTETGLLFGLHLFSPDVVLHLVSVEYEERVFWPICQRIYQGLAEKLGVSPGIGPRENARFDGGFLGEGYAKPTPECVQAMERLARAEGVFVDTTYNAKVLAGLEDAGRRGIAEGGTLFWHTGGVPSLFG